MSELFYINDQGLNVHTSQFLKNRGSCCQSNCLHCPYGTTLKNFGLQFSLVEPSQIELAKELYQKDDAKEDVASMLLSSAFGAPKAKSNSISEANLDSFRFVLLKETICGLVEVNGQTVKKLFLEKYFQDQGLDQDTVQSYFYDSDV